MSTGSALDLERLEEEARAATGLEDFGAGPWREGLVELSRAAAAEARLNEVGRALLRREMLAQLINRLEIRDWTTRHPELRDERIEAPIVLATLPRTGQTAAGWLLDRDPRNRSLYTWLAKRPVPPPQPGDNADDPRLARERASVAAMPAELRRMHLSAADEPDECHWLISNAFRGAHQIYSMRVPSYYAWSVDRADMRDAYACYRLQLQLLQSRTPGRRWVLKNSPHLLHLDELHEALPGAHYVQFHRDPLAVLASNCQLAVLLRGMRSDHVDRQEVGASILRLLRDYVERLLRFRDSDATPAWIDIDFEEFVSNPLHQVERIYTAIDCDLGNEARAAMQHWVERNPRDARRPDPDLTPFGLVAAEVREHFAAYSGRFGLRA